MDNVLVAKTAGFCFGVEKAVSTALSIAAENRGPVYTYGPLVHNAMVIDELRTAGIQDVRSMEELLTLPRGIVIIRAHGITKSEQETLKAEGFTPVDATCPFVKRIHEIAELVPEDANLLIIGDPEHPEVKGIAGWAKCPCFILSEIDQIEKIPFSKEKKLQIVVQTTFSLEKYKKIVEIICALSYNITIANTICNATKERQEEAGILASSVDAMIVIGDRQSSNSQKLYQICKEKCDHTYFIERTSDLHPYWYHNVKFVGITAGASTPKKIIEEVQNYVRRV